MKTRDLPTVSPMRRRVLLAMLGFVMLALVGPVLLTGVSGALLAQDASAMRQAVAAKNIPRLQADLSSALPALTGLQTGLEGLVWVSDVPGWAPTYQAAVDWVRIAEKAAGLMQPLLGDVTQRMRAGALGAQQGGTKTPPAVLAALGASLPAVTADIWAHVKTLQQILADLHQLPRHGVMHPLGALTQRWDPVLTSGIDTLLRVIPTIHRAMPALMHALGFPQPQRYLLFFQNIGEMRATGGFLTAYAVLTVNHGVLGPLQVHNIYSLAPQIRYRPPAPNVIAYEFGLDHWHLRDANTSPNVPTTVQTIYRFWNSIPHHPVVNGVLFVNVWMADQLIQDLGHVAVTAANHHAVLTPSNANVTMEYLAERAHYANPLQRKQFLGALFHGVLKGIEQGSMAVKTRTLQSIAMGLQRKWLLFYFNNPAEEQWVTQLGWAGKTIRHTHGANYLQVVDENLGGHKDNLYLKEQVTTEIQQSGSDQYVEVTRITLTNPALYNGWLVVPYQGLLKLYVPRGAQLLDLDGSNGFRQDYVNRTLNKTVVGGFVGMGVRRSIASPPATLTLTVAYRLPPLSHLHHLVIQEQPGSRSVPLTVEMGSYRRTLLLRHDETLTIPASAKPTPYYGG